MMDATEIVSPRLLGQSVAHNMGEGAIMAGAAVGSEVPPLHLLLLDRGAAAAQQEAEQTMKDSMKLKQDL